jgi:hypothetical protein
VREPGDAQRSANGLGGEQRLQDSFLERFKAIFLEDSVESVKSDEAGSQELDSNELSFFVDIQNHVRLDFPAMRALLFFLPRKVEIRHPGAAVPIGDF